MPASESYVQYFSSLELECSSALILRDSESYRKTLESFRISQTSPQRLTLVPNTPFSEGRVNIDFSFLTDSSGRVLNNATYTLTVDRSKPTVVSEFGSKLVGTNDFSKGTIELTFSEDMVGIGEPGNYSFGGIGGNDLVVSDVTKLGENKVRIFTLGDVNRFGGEILISIKNVFDLAGNELSANSVRINNIGTRIVSNLLQARRNHASVYHNGRIYIFGGRITNSATTALNTLEVFNVNTLELEKTLSWGAGIAPSISLLKAYLLTDNRIMMVGGVNASSVNLFTSFFFDPVTENFTVGPNLAGSRRDFTTYSIGSEHYIIGGNGTGSTTIEKYSEFSNVFTTAFTMQMARTTVTSICSYENSTLSIFGGATGFGNFDAIETFNLSTNVTTVSSSIDAIGNLVCKLEPGRFRFAGQSNNAQFWNPSLDTKTSEFSMEQASRSGFASFAFSDTQDIIIGGLIGANVTDSIELIDWETSRSRQIAKLNYPKSSGTFTKIPNENRAFYIGGQYGNASYNTIEEIRW